MATQVGSVAGACLLTMSLVVASAPLQAAENDPGALVSTNVDSISVRQVGAIPVIEVSASGAQYDTVASPLFSMHYDAAVRCKGLWDVHYFEVALGGANSWYDVKGLNYQHKPIGSYTDLLAAWGVDTQDKSRSANNRSLIGPIKPQLRDAAIAKCRLESQKAADQGQTSLAKAMATQRQFPLQSAWIDANLRLQAWTSCGMPKDHITWLSVFDEAPDILVRCKARPYAEGVDTGGLPTQLDQPFRITGLELSATPSAYQGSCPRLVRFEGLVTANKAGSVDYRWRIGNSQSAPKTLVFEQAGSRKLSHEVTVEQSWQRSVMLLTGGPGRTASNIVDVKVSCLNVPVPANPGYAPAPSPPPPPPKPPRAKLPPPTPAQGADLAPGASISIGNRSAAWGHTLTVNALQASLGMQGNACGLALSYEVRNTGQGQAAASKSRLSIGANNVHQANLAPLPGGSDHAVQGLLHLANGDYDLVVVVDAAGQVAETDEGNNSRTVRLKVRNCGQPGN